MLISNIIFARFFAFVDIQTSFTVGVFEVESEIFGKVGVGKFSKLGV